MKNYEDKTLKCQECGEDFTFTAGEQEFFAERGYTEPLRCKPCRDARKNKKPYSKPRFEERN